MVDLTNLAIALPSGSDAVVQLAIIVVVAIVLLIGLRIAFNMGRHVLRFGFAIVLNSLLGLVSMLLLDQFFNTGIPIQLYTIIPITIFGLPALVTILILRLFHIPLTPV